MRIINADKVRTIIVDEMWNVDDLPHDEQQAVIKACYSIWERIEKRALIGDAIPKEWIKKYMDKVDIEDCGMVYLSPSAPFRDMLKEWERANETN